jgi:TolB-like protein/Tfp pilus assembly protein PilF
LSFFNELNRRNVFRVAIVYVVTAWLIAQVAGLAADSFGAPAWVMKMIITMLALGAPVALVMAWAYELTPGGLRRDSGTATRQAPAGKLDRSIIIVLTVALAYFAWDKFILVPQRDEALLESVSTQPVEILPQNASQSIAVLAFVNMSDDSGNEYFSDGLSEELLNLLVKIPELRVAARTSSFSFKGKDVKISQIGNELNVTYVLEGSVRKAGDQIRVTAQLIKADDGFHVWSETFDRNLDDIFVVQDEIAAAVVGGLKVTLLGELPEQRRTDPEVYTLYLQGIYFNNLGGKENSQKAVQALKQALAIDPEYAPAWSILSYSISRLEFHGGLPRDEAIALAMQALDKALEIDDQLASAWAGLAWMKRTVFWDWQGARAALEKALQLEPNNDHVISTAASIASTFGELDKAIELFERNVESNPLSLSTLTALGNRYVAAGRHVEARALFERVLALNPEYPGTRAKIAITYLHEGRPEEVLAQLTGLPDGDPFRQLKAAALFDMGETQKAQMALDDFLESPRKDGPFLVALLYAWRGENDEAFEWLEMAFEQRIPALSYILINPPLTRLKDDPRYPIFLEKMGLREAWEAMPSEYGGPSK